MPSTFSPNVNLELMLTGEDDGTWGIKTDSNLSILDLRLGGRLNISVAGSSNVTLSGAQAENVVHVLTGVLTGSINYTFPAKGGIYVIANQTTGAFTVTVAMTGGSGTHVIPQGSVDTIFVNPDGNAGIGFIATNNPVGGAGTVTSLSAGSGITLTPDPITGSGTIALTPAATGVTSLSAGANITLTPNPITSSGTISGASWVSSVYAVNGLVASPQPITASGTIGLAPIGDTGVLCNITGATGIPQGFGAGSLLDHCFGATAFAFLFRYGGGWAQLGANTTPGLVLTSNGANPPYWGAGGGSGRLIAFSAYGGPGTYTWSPQAATTVIIVQVYGAGGGGGGAIHVAGAWSAGGGGGSGGWAFYRVGNPGAQTVSVGGGAGGSGPTGVGGTGGTASFGGIVAATGGGGGLAGFGTTVGNVCGYGGNGGGPSGSYNFGTSGSPGRVGLITANSISVGGAGGGSPWGNSASTVIGGAGNGANGAAGGWGAGGAGAANTQQRAGDAAGGAGGPGLVLVWEYT